VYKGLDIVTAKVTPAERKAAPHHMLDIVDPLTNFSVIDFRDMALPIVIVTFRSLFPRQRRRPTFNTIATITRQ